MDAVVIEMLLKRSLLVVTLECRSEAGAALVVVLEKKSYFCSSLVIFALRFVWAAMDATIGSDTLLMPLKTSRSVPNDPIVASGGHM